MLLLVLCDDDKLLFNEEDKDALLPVLLPPLFELLLFWELNCNPLDNTLGAEVFKPRSGTAGLIKRSLVRRPCKREIKRKLII